MYSSFSAQPSEKSSEKDQGTYLYLCDQNDGTGKEFVTRKINFAIGQEVTISRQQTGPGRDKQNPSNLIFDCGGRFFHSNDYCI